MMFWVCIFAGILCQAIALSQTYGRAKKFGSASYAGLVVGIISMVMFYLAGTLA